MPKRTASPCPSRTRTAFEVLIEGPDDLLRPLLLESGGHRWQRVPPTERRGRVHTSTVTVAAFEIQDEFRSDGSRGWILNERDIQTFTTKDSGPGGQHRNKTESCVVMRHLPTGIEAKAASKSQHQNRRLARQTLEARVAAYSAASLKNGKDIERRAKVGSGQRADKIRTYREQDDQVTDHRSGARARLKDIRRGDLKRLLC